MGILLSDEEIDKLIYPRGQGKKAVAKAQLRKVVDFIDWLDDGVRSSASWRTEVRLFRKALKKEVDNERQETSRRPQEA